jgi:hypothetical protein
VSFGPRGEVRPQGWRSSVCPSILLNNIVCSSLGVNEGVNISHRGQRSPLGANFSTGGKLYPWVKTFPRGVNFTPGCKLHPWGQTFPRGVNFTPGCKLHPWGQTHVFKAGLRKLKCASLRSLNAPIRLAQLGVACSWGRWQDEFVKKIAQNVA